MLPSLLARDIEAGLKQFLITAFEPSDDFFHGLVSRYLENESGWMKGPFVQTGLPFRPGPAGRGFFEGFETQKTSYTHQERSWQRLASQLGASNTIVATGTGSGKTECFLYPVLDHCAKARRAGEPGVKALVIYPMNALATDQARRFAETIATTPAFNGLRVGLFIGGHFGQPGSGMVMSPTSVITDRETLRKTPPDVLLTNYKMLDYLLLRPKDRQLWSRNSPTTLRYIVVDELHTFDGAQGTDLALLLRRLRARLQVPEGHLLCVGTSATLGATADTAPLREYARQVFAAPFTEGAVIVEDRLATAEFLGDTTIEHVLQPRGDFGEVLDPTRYLRQEEAVSAWFKVFFSDLPASFDVTDGAWRVSLGDRLKRHLLFVNLLKLMKGGVIDYPDLLRQMQGPLPAGARPYVRQVLDALLVLVAWARSDDGTQPFVTLRLQVWIRELRRMVAKVASAPESVDMRADADLGAAPGALYLPLVQCSECHTTGWLSRLAPGSSKVSTKRDEIYSTWFARRPEAVRLYPGRRLMLREVDALGSSAVDTPANRHRLLRLDRSHVVMVGLSSGRCQRALSASDARRVSSDSQWHVPFARFDRQNTIPDRICHSMPKSRPRVPHQPKILEAKVKRFGRWELISIEHALETKEQYAHCPECDELLRPHRRGRNGMGAHFEHQHENSNCSLCYTHKA